MVWFYLAIAKSLASDYNVFQSHYGLILSVKSDVVGQRFDELSIPLWSDFILSESGKDRQKLFAFNPTMVWFYPAYSQYHTASVTTFQSHYGLILSWL